jgi:hypothetical protein
MSDQPDQTVSVSADDEELAMKKAREMLSISGTDYDQLRVHSRDELDPDIVEMTDADGRYRYVIDVIR